LIEARTGTDGARSAHWAVVANTAVPQRQQSTNHPQTRAATHGRTFAPEKSRARWLAKFTTPLERFNRYAEGGFPLYRST
jgi:hypothetical protein